MNDLTRKMYSEISEAKKDKRKNVGDIDVDFVANTRTALKNGVCRVRFINSDGELIDAVGTAKNDVLKYGIKGRRARYLITTPFIDLEKVKWRSFRWDRLVSCELMK